MNYLIILVVLNHCLTITSITILFSEVYIYLISGFISEDAQMLNFSKFSVRL